MRRSAKILTLKCAKIGVNKGQMVLLERNKATVFQITAFKRFCRRGNAYFFLDFGGFLFIPPYKVLLYKIDLLF